MPRALNTCSRFSVIILLGFCFTKLLFYLECCKYVFESRKGKCESIKEKSESLMLEYENIEI